MTSKQLEKKCKKRLYKLVRDTENELSISKQDKDISDAWYDMAVLFYNYFLISDAKR